MGGCSCLQRRTACQWTQPNMYPTQTMACPSGTALNSHGWVPAPNHAAWVCQHPGQSSRPVWSGLCFGLYSHLPLCGGGMFDTPKNTACCTFPHFPLFYSGNLFCRPACGTHSSSGHQSMPLMPTATATVFALWPLLTAPCRGQAVQLTPQASPSISESQASPRSA